MASFTFFVFFLSWGRLDDAVTGVVGTVLERW